MMGVTALAAVGPSRVAGAVLPFDAATLNVSFSLAGAPAVWKPGTADALNLKGSFHALDCYDTPANCIASYDAAMLPGVVSRSGWALVDDTSAARLVAPDASAPSPTPFWYANASAHTRPAADLYLFAHGHDYAAAVADFALISGPPSLPPSSVFGVWWSHWQSFNQSFFEQDILANYRKNALPLNHVMLDVDWHTELGALPSNKSVKCYDYGGYSVNTDLWPAWPAFVASLKDGSNPSGFSRTFCAGSWRTRRSPPICCTTPGATILAVSCARAYLKRTAAATRRSSPTGCFTFGGCRPASPCPSCARTRASGACP
jgi:hypothetical protein